jgi:hypothetical protein
MLLLIPTSLSPISFHTIGIGSDRFLWKLYVFLQQLITATQCGSLSSYTLAIACKKRLKSCRHGPDSAEKSPPQSERSVIPVYLCAGFW